MNKKRWYWTLQVGGWTLYAILQIVVFEISQRPTTLSDILVLCAEALSFLILTHLFRNFLISSGWLSLDFRRLIPRVLLGVLVIGITVFFLRGLISIPLGFNSEVLFGINAFGVSAANTVIALLWSIFYLIYHYFERYNLSLKRQAEINEIELSNLKSQLNPHFIFNSLNSIRALVDEDPKKSKLAITQLSTILRSTLASDQNMLTGFDDELLTVKNYLGLESIRYEERLRVRYSIDPGSQRFMLPPLMLQTLVENGIKHGISQLKQGGDICICTKVDNDELKIEIRNSGKLRQHNGHSKRSKGGLGLYNTRKRLALIYGEEAHFDIRNTPEGNVCTELIIPLKTLENESNNRRR